MTAAYFRTDALTPFCISLPTGFSAIFPSELIGFRLLWGARPLSHEKDGHI
jgi:hypothetical protein